jgi:hypothetical protein
VAVIYRITKPQPPDTYERPLGRVFWNDDRELSTRIARVCVLFEDLRIEYHCSRADEELPLDALSRMYRRFYFLRRSLVTLDEFGGALNRLNAIRQWKDHVSGSSDPQRRQVWTDAVRFFNEKKDRFATIRGDIGAHYPERAAAWAVERLKPGTTGSMEIVYGDDTADAKLHFATELVASVVLRTATPEGSELTNEQIDAFVHGVFDDVTDGWRHAVNSVCVVIGAFLVPRFRQALTP